MIGYYNYTVWLTYISLLSGGIGICMAFDSHPIIAVLCLIISGVCDMFDGRVARTKKNRTNNEKFYGIQIDSLSDLICFGVLPVCIGIGIGLKELYYIPIFAFFFLFGMIRLSYYNVLELDKLNKHQEIDDGVIVDEVDNLELDLKEKPIKSYFVGLPITSSAIFVPLMFTLYNVVDIEIFKYIYISVLTIVGILYVVKIKIPKPNFLVSILFSIAGLAMCILLVILNIKKM